MNQDRILYKIISGRTSFKLGDLFLSFHEPDSNIISDSYVAYDEAYDRAYGSNCITEEEKNIKLIELDIWTPQHEKELERLKKAIEDKKVYIYHNFYNKREFSIAKRELALLERKYKEFISSKYKLDFLTCHSVAENARWNWIFSVCTYHNGSVIGPEISPESVNKVYASKMADNDQIRELAKMDLWRSIWNCNKIHGGLLFNRTPTDYSRDQINLCSFSIMYDNVYEHPESPNEKIIDDNDALDGWLIVQRKNSDSEKLKNEKLTKNNKIANSQEQFIMASSPEEAELIYNMNTENAKNIIKQRFELIDKKGQVKDTEFADRQNEIQIAQMKSLKNHIRGK